MPPRNILVFQVLPGGEVRVRNGGSTESRLVGPELVPDLWRAAVADNPLLIAAVQTSTETRYGHMIDVLDGLRVAGARRVSLSLLDDGGAPGPSPSPGR